METNKSIYIIEDNEVKGILLGKFRMFLLKKLLFKQTYNLDTYTSGNLFYNVNSKAGIKNFKTFKDIYNKEFPKHRNFPL